MSFLTEYFDEYRELPLRKTEMCRPETRFPFKEGREWYDPKKGSQGHEVMSDEQIGEFITKTMMELRGCSTYFNDHCALLDQDPPCSEEEARKAEVKCAEIILKPPLALKDTELIMKAKNLYEQPKDRPTLKPLQTHFTLLGYIRPNYFTTGISEYADTICKLAYENVVNDRLPRFVPNNGNKPKWGIPPDEPRQPELDIVPFEGERLF